MNPYPVHEITLDMISKYMREGPGWLYQDEKPIINRLPDENLSYSIPASKRGTKTEAQKMNQTCPRSALTDPPRGAPSLCLLSHAQRPFGFEFFRFIQKIE
jgi:hypothetical protein